MCAGEDGTIEFTMSAVRLTKNGHVYVDEDPERFQARTTIANKYIEQGLTYKHAWFKAFQELPRVERTSHAPTDDSVPRNALHTEGV